MLVGLVALFFARVLSARYHIPYDLNGFYYPLLSLVAEGVRTGSLPLWDPYLYGGMPLAGNPQGQLFYPPTLLFLFLVGGDPLLYRHVEYLLVGHYVVGGVTSYLALRKGFDLSPPSALLGSCVYLFGGFVASFSSHLGSISGAAWLPLVLWGGKRAVERLSWRTAWGTGCALALVFLSGFPPFALMVVTVLTIGAGVVVSRALLGRKGGDALRLCAIFVVLLFVGVALAAIQIIPMLETVTRSIADERPEHFAVQGLQPESYLTFLLPNATGVGTGTVSGMDGRPLLYLYVGVLPLALAGIGARVGRHGDRAVLLGLFLLGLFWMLGDLLIVSRFLADFTPPVIGRGYYPFLSLLLFQLGVAALAALGAEALGRPQGEERPWVAWVLRGVGGGLCIALILAISFQFFLYLQPPEDPVRPLKVIEGLWVFAILAGVSWGVLWWAWRGTSGGRRLVAWSMVAVVVLDLFSFGAGRHFNAQPGPPESLLGPRSLHGHSALIEWLQGDSDLGRGRFFRIDVQTRGGLWYLAPRLWRLESTNGDDPLLLRAYRAVRHLVSVSEDLSPRWGPYRRFALRDARSPVVDLLGIRYLIADDSLHPGVTAGSPGRFTLVDVIDGHHVYRNAAPLPRAIVVSRAVVMDSLEAVLAYLGSDRFSPRDHAVVSADDARWLPLGLRTDPQAGSVRGGELPGWAEVLEYGLNRVKIRANLHRAGILHVSDVYFPGWRVTVDGQDHPIIRANGAFRAVALEAGEHEVVFRYAPTSVRIGLIITTLALLATGLVAAPFWRRRRR